MKEGGPMDLGTILQAAKEMTQEQLTEIVKLINDILTRQSIEAFDPEHIEEYVL